MMSLGFDRSPSSFQATCSAVMLSRNLRSVNLTPPVEYEVHPLAWAWLAYALLSREASHCIEEIGLQASGLTSKDANAFELVLQANDPLAVVLANPEGNFTLPPQVKTMREPVVVDLRPQTDLLLLRSMSTKYQVVSIPTGNQVETLRVIDESSNTRYVSVVYPGIGPVWVLRDSILERRVIQLPQQNGQQSIRRLKVDVADYTCMDAVVRVLQLIGRNLESLALHSFDMPIRVDQDELQSMLSACPRLLRLDLVNIEVSDLKWVTTSGLSSVYLDSVTTNRVPPVYPNGF